MAEFPAFPLWTDAYLGDTTHLTTIEHGAYLLLLMAMWRNNGSLPDDDRMLSRYARLTAGQWHRIAPTVRAFFTPRDGFLSQGRLTDELDAVRRNSKRQSDNVKARWRKTKEKVDTTAVPSGTSGNTPLPLPLPPVEVSSESKLSLAHVAEPSRFSDFWQQYPHRGGAKKGKASAQRVWDRLMKAKTPQDQIITGAMRYAGDRQVLAGYAKDPATWLNARGWEDEIETGVAPIGGTRHDRQSADRAFHQAIGQLADGLSAGTVQLDFASRDPFAQR